MDRRCPARLFVLVGHCLPVMSLIERMRRAGLHADGGAVHHAVLPSRVPPPSVAAPGRSTCRPTASPWTARPSYRKRCLHWLRSNRPTSTALWRPCPAARPMCRTSTRWHRCRRASSSHDQRKPKGSTYLSYSLLAFDSREKLDGFLAALQAVVARHDVLRRRIAWEELPEPMQGRVCARDSCRWRRCSCRAGRGGGRRPPVGGTLRPAALPDRPRRRPADARLRCPRRGPRALAAQRAAEPSFVGGSHHPGDPGRRRSSASARTGRPTCRRHCPTATSAARAPGAQAGGARGLFRRMLGDVDEPTAPFGLLDVQGDGSGIQEAQLRLEEDLARRIRDRARALKVGAAKCLHLAWAQVLARMSGRDGGVWHRVVWPHAHRAARGPTG